MPKEDVQKLLNVVRMIFGRFFTKFLILVSNENPRKELDINEHVRLSNITLWLSWSRSYGSLIYKYLYNQCLSPLML